MHVGPCVHPLSNRIGSPRFPNQTPTNLDQRPGLVGVCPRRWRREEGKGYRYLIGGTEDYQQALKLQREARKEFPDAFVVAYEGERQLSVKTARERTNQ